MTVQLLEYGGLIVEEVSRRGVSASHRHETAPVSIIGTLPKGGRPTLGELSELIKSGDPEVVHRLTRAGIPVEGSSVQVSTFNSSL